MLQSFSVFGVILVILACFLTLGVWRRVAACLIGMGLFYLINTLAIKATLNELFIGWLLLLFIFIPTGEPLVAAKKININIWQMPWFVVLSAWIILVAYYSFSALTTLQNMAFSDGTVLSSRAYGNFLVHLLLALPPLVLSIATWGFLLFELAFAPLCLFNKARAWAWLLMLLIQIVGFLIFRDQVFGLILLHLFVFDPRFIKAPPYKERPIVFFDGHCGLCNCFVDFALTEDRRHNLLFSPLQGEAAKSRVGRLELEKLESIILFDNNKIYRQSDAILRMLAYLGGLWPLLSFSRAIPRQFRDFLYYIIAQNRYAWFGKHEACRLPTREQRQFFIP